MAPKRRKKKSQFQHRYEHEFLDEDTTKAVHDEISNLFNKKFTLKDRDQSWMLPDSHCLFKEDPFTIKELLALKDDLNSTKSLLNDMDIDQWHQHTRRTHKAGLVVRHLREKAQAEMCTQAWAKFLEILVTYELIPRQALESKEMNSIHLCEAPGAFIACMNHHLKNNVLSEMKWKWIGLTLNPYYEGNDLNAMLDDDSFIFETKENWNFGSDGTGDLMSVDNLKSLKQDCGVAMGSVHLVTADGSINCADDPAEQEKVVGQLIFCEAVAALEILSEGGNYVFKMFTALEYHMIGLVYLLCCLFKEVHFMKPGTSKSGNSEVYVICMDYSGALPVGYQEILHGFYNSNIPNKALFPLRLIPTEYMDRLSRCQHYFIEKQKDEIIENINHFHHMGELEKKVSFHIRNRAALHYISVFNVRPLEETNRIVHRCYLDGIQRVQPDVNANEQFSNRKQSGTYNERHQHHYTWLDSIKHDEVFAFDPSSTSLAGLCQTNKGTQLIPLLPEDVEWLLYPATDDTTELIFTMTKGKKIEQILNSRFCSSHYITTLNTAMERASILDPGQKNALVQILQDTSVVLTADSKPCSHCGAYLITVLDRLVMFTDRKLRNNDDVTTSLLLGTQLPCDCFGSYLCSQGIQVICTQSENPEQADGVDIVVSPFLNCIPVLALENIRYPLELLTKKDLLDTCIAALKVLKCGGTFVCRIYTSLTRYTLGILCILHRVFQRLTIVKPVVGYLCHSERFLVCKGYLGCGQGLLSHLEQASKAMTACQADEDVLELVDIKCLYEDEFFAFVWRMNERLAHIQLLNIVKLETFYHFPAAMTTNEERVKISEEVKRHFNLPTSH